MLRRIYGLWRIKYGIDLPLSTNVGRRLRIFHYGNIFINCKAVLCDDVSIMHGCTIGNSMSSDACPFISSGVFLGAGSKVIGDVFIAEGVKVGANAVVVKSCRNVGATLVGVPAHKKISGV